MHRKLSNAPVYYVLAQAQFNPVVAMEKYINEIQDRLRIEEYTLFEPKKITQLHFEAPSSSSQTKAEVVELPVWNITKLNRSAGFTLGQTSLSYHTTNYQTHKQFFTEFLLGLEIIHSIIKLEHLSRLGLRYLNAVLPKEREHVDMYLSIGLHGVVLDAKAKERYSLNESVFDTDLTSCSGTLVNRIYRKTGSLGYPPDILSNILLPMEKFTRANPLLHAVIDIDHFIEGQTSLDFEQIKVLLKSLHESIKQAFDSTVTVFAKETWA